MKESGEPSLRPLRTCFVDKFLSTVDISLGDLLPILAIIREIAPATCGQDWEVPVKTKTPLSLLLPAPRMLTPGAKMSRHLPMTVIQW